MADRFGCFKHGASIFPQRLYPSPGRQVWLLQNGTNASQQRTGVAASNRQHLLIPPNNNFAPFLADNLGCFESAPAPPNSDFSRQLGLVASKWRQNLP